MLDMHHATLMLQQIHIRKRRDPAEPHCNDIYMCQTACMRDVKIVQAGYGARLMALMARSRLYSS